MKASSKNVPSTVAQQINEYRSEIKNMRKQINKYIRENVLLEKLREQHKEVKERLLRASEDNATLIQSLK